jgi:hypothetical protein
MKYFLSAALLLLIIFNTRAQTSKYRVVSVPVVRNGVNVKDPWTGGMDSPQFSACDLNQDGIADLFIFDRVSNRVLTYLSNGEGTDNRYTYAPQYESLFPSDLSFWALIRDYNHDGIPDIFTYAATSSGPGTRVFKGSIQNGQLHFDLVCAGIQYIDSPYTPYILTNINDVPPFADVNGDGDLDVLTYSLDGTTISYYENLTSENPGNPAYSPDSFKYVLVTSCWGNVLQDLYTNSISLNQACKGGGGDQQPGGLRHAGNSLFAVTDPVYKDVDLLNGNIGFSNLFLLRNCGGNEIANVCEWDSVYPSCNVPMFMPVYPAVYGMNISGGASQDLLLSPASGNPFNGTTGVGRNVFNVQYYESTGDTACWYTYQSDSFLVHNTLDFGSGSKPLFYDFDGDGLTDIVVGNYGYSQPGQISQNETSALAFYRNTGTASAPVFTEVSADYDSLSKFNIAVMDPAFGDLNGDGKNDLLIGDQAGNLNYFENTASVGSSFPVLTAAQFDGLRTDDYAAPFIYDVNGDGLNDIVVGMQNGTLSYYWNFGTKTNPMFSQDSVNTSFGNINVTFHNAYGFSQPYIHPDGAGNLMLYVGSLSGAVYEYQIDQTQLKGGSFSLINSNFVGNLPAANSSISIADINNDGKLEYVVGNASGGLLLFSDSLWDPETILAIPSIAPAKTHMNIYPDPAKDYFFCTPASGTFINPVTAVFNLLGGEVNMNAQLNNGKVLLNPSQVDNGFYIIKINDADQVYTGKVLVMH